MFKKNDLCKFLVTAKRSTYAAGDTADKVINDDKSTTLVFKEGDWKYHDNYFGGEPYGGREVVFYKNQPIYIMTYYGLVDESVDDFNPIYAFLMEALKLIPEEHPYRGPNRHDQNNLSYYNNFTGEIDNFSGEEIIKEDGNEIYRAKYLGGFVDLKR